MRSTSNLPPYADLENFPEKSVLSIFFRTCFRNATFLVVQFEVKVVQFRQNCTIGK